MWWKPTRPARGIHWEREYEGWSLTLVPLWACCASRERADKVDKIYLDVGKTLVGFAPAILLKVVERALVPWKHV